MRPVLFSVPFFDLDVRSYPVMLAGAAAIGLWLGPHWAFALEGLNPRRTRTALAMLGVAALVGARLHFVAAHWSWFLGNPLSAGRFWQGMHAGGGLVALALAAPFVTRWLRLPLGRFADGIAPGVASALAAQRIGCYLQGCCFGTHCSWIWCVPFPSTDGLDVHPLQLYFALANIALAVLAFSLHRRKRYDGEVALLCLLLFSLIAAALELLRYDSVLRTYWGPLPQLQWVALAMATGCLVALVTVSRAQGSRTPRRRIPS